MNFELIFNTRAFDEIDNAYNYYYYKVSPSVALEFDTDLENTYHALSINPFYFKRHGNIRAIPLRKFPFLIFFEVFESDSIVKIYSVFNTSQDQTK